MQHRVRRGDTLWGLAKRYDTTVERLARANRIEDPDRLAAGQRLRVPDVFTSDEALDAGAPEAPPGRRSRRAAEPRPPPPPPGGPTSIAGLGSLSARFESNGDPGAVSGGRGDPGGISYGAYQFSTNVGAARAFSAWLQRTSPTLGRPLAGLAPGTAAFSNAWRQLARTSPGAFLEAQHRFVGERYYEAARTQLRARLPGLDFTRRSVALNDVLWSTAVHHGQAGAVTVFTRALAGRDPARLTDAEVITAVYAERGRRDAGGELAYFSSSSRAVQRGVAQRFVAERDEALASL
ncbi:MAG: LysM peptidoglycan-binding domain-containing protein [Myxococcaceae bacterium]|jgi:LysM repeat protein|nr:LysM peptidoglycan-binding domain-containing protein [Myxococcaceae bacterium]MCA3015222.1 LysM peptidoglycan-binding domain-containing protein [Myxococcaceae bacterium]